VDASHVRGVIQLGAFDPLLVPDYAPKCPMNLDGCQHAQYMSQACMLMGVRIAPGQMLLTRMR
jgi:hypothetical protein